MSRSNISPAPGGPQEAAVLTTGEAPVLREAKLGVGPACWEKIDPGWLLAQVTWGVFPGSLLNPVPGKYRKRHMT